MTELTDKWFQIVVNKTQEIKVLIDAIFIQSIANEAIEDDNKKLTTKNKRLFNENKSLGSELLKLTNKNDRLAQRVINAEDEIRQQNPTLDRCDRHEGFDDNCPLCHAMALFRKEKHNE